MATTWSSEQTGAHPITCMCACYVVHIILTIGARIVVRTYCTYAAYSASIPVHFFIASSSFYSPTPSPHNLSLSLSGRPWLFMDVGAQDIRTRAAGHPEPPLQLLKPGPYIARSGAQERIRAGAARAFSLPSNKSLAPGGSLHKHWTVIIMCYDRAHAPTCFSLCNIS